MEYEFLNRAVHRGFISLEQSKSYLKEYKSQINNVPLHQWLLEKKYLNQMQIFSIGNQNIDQTHFGSSNESPAFPQEIGHYQIQQKLGEGGMGVVYKALDTKLQRIVALKIIATKNFHSELYQRFLQEAKATAQLEHPNIIKLFDAQSSPLHYFTMEYIDGQILGTFAKNHKIKSTLLAKIMHKVALALYEAHKKGIIHRDIKPSNIMLNKDYEPKLMDFGLAKLNHMDSCQTRHSDILGTPSYMSPEQAGGKKIGKKSDIYSLGATLYELLTGRPPFESEFIFNIIYQISHSDPIAPRQLNPDVPKELEAICLKCLEKNPHRRYNTAKALAQDLQNFLHNKPITAISPNFATHVRKFILRNKKFSFAIVFAIVIVIASIGGYLNVVYQHNQKLLKEKIKAQQAQKTAEQERENVQMEKEASHKAMGEMLNVFYQMSLEIQDLQTHPAFNKGLHRVFAEFKRLNLLSKLLKDKRYQQFAKLYGMVYGSSPNQKDFA